MNTYDFVKEEAVQNVTFEGITFESGVETFLELYNGGDITFRNCLFRVRDIVRALLTT